MKQRNSTLVQKQCVQEESQQYTWIAQISNIIKMKRKLPKDYSIRSIQEKDKSKLSELYFASYNREVVKNLTEAQKEMDLVFQNEYGLLDFSASFNIIHNSIIVAAIISVEQAPWYDTPSGPFIIELMVNPNHRQRGLAEYLLLHTADKLTESGAKTIALRVMSDNMKALNLYRKCGFVCWDDKRKKNLRILIPGKV